MDITYYYNIIITIIASLVLLMGAAADVCCFCLLRPITHPSVHTNNVQNTRMSFVVLVRNRLTANQNNEYPA